VEEVQRREVNAIPILADVTRYIDCEADGGGSRAAARQYQCSGQQNYAIQNHQLGPYQAWR
jgi:hypothetical protein